VKKEAENRREDIKALIAAMHRKGLSASRIGCAHLVISAGSPRPSGTRSSPSRRAPASNCPASSPPPTSSSPLTRR
jgi:hypothetical protein